MENEAARPPQLPSIFHWEDHSDETPHPRTKWIREYREIVSGRIVRRAVKRTEKDKDTHYRRHGVQVYTLAFTAGGGMSQKSRSFFDNMCLMFDRHDIGAQFKFRKESVARVAQLITRFAASLYSAHAAEVAAK